VRKITILTCATILICVHLSLTGFSQKEKVSWNQSSKIAGEIHLPKGKGLCPAIMIIGGSGSLSKDAPIYQMHSKKFTDMGFVVLVYDKRGTGESSGDWRTADFNDLARDAQGGLDMLLNHPRIDKKRIGILGISQGFWIGLLLDSLNKNISFMIMNSPAPMTPADQGAFIIENTLKEKGYDDSIIARATDLNKKAEQVYRTNTGWVEASSELSVYQNESWYKDAGLGLQSQDSWNWKWYAKIMDFDPAPYINTLSCPMIALHGENDPIVPAAKCAGILDSSKSDRNKDIVNVIVEDAVHTAQTGRNKWPDENREPIATWLKEKKILY